MVPENKISFLTEMQHHAKRGRVGSILTILRARTWQVLSEERKWHSEKNRRSEHKGVRSETLYLRALYRTPCLLSNL